MDFEVSISELTKLHGESGLETLEEYGGVFNLAQKLRVNLELGVKKAEVQQRQQVFGRNKIKEKESKTYLQLLLGTFQDATIQLLCACAIISIVIAFTLNTEEEYGWIEGFAILGTVFGVSNIQAMQDWCKERKFRSLNAEVQSVDLNVIRDGRQTEVLKYEIVVGDVVILSVGDILEADGVLFQGEEVECDESAMTGEPEDIKKSVENAPFLFAGTSVKNGSGRFLVTAVGVNSMNGKITALVRGQKVGDVEAQKETENDGGGPISRCLSSLFPCCCSGGDDEEEESSSVLTLKLDAMAGRIAYFAFGSAGIASTVMLLHFIWEAYIEGKRGFDLGEDLRSILDCVVTGIAIVVVAVPEGLPLAVALALSLSVGKMMADNNMVKHLDATETMGSATTVCSDKTGTLTLNTMSVARIYAAGQEFIGENENSDRSCGKLLLRTNIVSQGYKDKLCEGVCCNKADGTTIRWREDGSNKWEQNGNKTDCALLAFASDLGVDYNELRRKPIYNLPDASGNSRFGLKNYPFSSARKRSGMAIATTEKPGGPCRLHVKGASEIILALCTTQLTAAGTVKPLGEKEKGLIHKHVIDKFAGLAMRTICIAYRDFESPPDWDAQLDEAETRRLTGQHAKAFEPETQLTLMAVFGIEDPLRDGVSDAIKDCNVAGVDVRMVTGDHKATAIAIARNCGILRRGIDYDAGDGQTLVNKYTAMTGEEFRGLVLDKAGNINQDAFDQVWPHLRVLARSSPEDKHTLVTGLCDSELFATTEGQRLPIYPDKQIVAVTGDGTNDAPALRKAHVGFAMNLTGTRVAQDAADILLLDDNFASVVKALLWGRNVYDSIVKFLQFQLTVNITAVSFSVIGAVMIGGAPLSVVQMLWVNLIMDSLGALALASEPPTQDLLHRAPYGRNKGLISYEMWCNMLGQSVYQLTVLCVVLFAGAGESLPDDADYHDVATPGGFLDLSRGGGHHHPPSIHYTLLFNVFVFMNLFNWINCRKLRHELNVVKGVENNYVFIFIWLGCVAVQLLIVEGAYFFGGETNQAVKTTSLLASRPDLWLVSVAFGAFAMVWYWVVVAVGQSLKSRLSRNENEFKPLGAGLGNSSIKTELDEPFKMPIVQEAPVEPADVKIAVAPTELEAALESEAKISAINATALKACQDRDQNAFREFKKLSISEEKNTPRKHLVSVALSERVKRIEM